MELHNIINGELRPAASYRDAGTWRLPNVSDRDLSLALKVARAPRPTDRRTVMEALRRIGKEASWMDREQCRLQAIHTRTPLHHIMTNARYINSWLASIDDYVERVIDGGPTGVGHELAWQGGLPTMAVLAGNEYTQAPWVIANALLADARLIIKPSGVDPSPPYLFVKALLEHGITSIQMLFLDSSTDHGKQQIRTAITGTDQSIVFGEDSTIAAVYDGCPGLHRHKAIPFWTGRSGAIVFGDADLGAAALGLTEGATYSSGRNCLSTKKVFCAEPVADELERTLVTELCKLRRGPYDDEYVDLGPINREIRDRVLAHATLETVLYDDDALVVRCGVESTLVREEQACPLVAIVRAPDHALVELANRAVADTPGRRAMSMGVWTARREAFDVAARTLAAYKVVWNGPTNPWSIYTPHEGINLCRELMRPRAICVGRPSHYEAGKSRQKPWPW